MKTKVKSGPGASIARRVADVFVTTLVDDLMELGRSGVEPWDLSDSEALIVSLAMTITQWATPSEGWDQGAVESHFMARYQRVRPDMSEIGPDIVAEVVSDAFRDGRLDVGLYTIAEIELLLELSALCEHGQAARLLSIVEHFMDQAPDEAFEDGSDCAWIPADPLPFGRELDDAQYNYLASLQPGHVETINDLAFHRGPASTAFQMWAYDFGLIESTHEPELSSSGRASIWSAAFGVAIP